MSAPTSNGRPIGRRLERLRLRIGDIGVRVFLLLGLAIHVATVWIAFHYSEGLWAWIAAALSAAIPAIPEIYWAYRVFSYSGTLTHPYVVAVFGYPVAFVLFMLGGWLFFPEGESEAADATDPE